MTYDGEGRPSAVLYHLLTPMLLNELQQQRRASDSYRTEIEQLRAEIEQLRTAVTTRDAD